MPGTWSAGDLLILTAGASSAGTVSITTPSGWRLFDARGSHHGIYGRIAQGGDSAPTITFSDTGIHSAEISAYGGDVYTDLDTILVASNDRFATGNFLALPALNAATHGFNVANCLVIAYLARSKTSTSNGTTFAVPSNFTVADVSVPAGFFDAGQVSYWQQTTQTDIAQADIAITGSSESVAASGVIVALRSAAPRRRMLTMGVG